MMSLFRQYKVKNRLAGRQDMVSSPGQHSGIVAVFALAARVCSCKTRLRNYVRDRYGLEQVGGELDVLRRQRIFYGV